MAKIGNEARLILKLANARMKAQEEDLRNGKSNKPDDTFLMGYNQASRDWWEALIDIQRELERS